jgi:hypothetical protein
MSCSSNSVRIKLESKAPRSLIPGLPVLKGCGREPGSPGRAWAASAQGSSYLYRLTRTLAYTAWWAEGMGQPLALELANPPLCHMTSGSLPLLGVLLTCEM